MWWNFQRDFLFYQIIWDIGSIEEARRGCFCSTFHILRPSHRKTSASGNGDLSLRGILPILHLQTNIQVDRILCDRRAPVLQLLNKVRVIIIIWCFPRKASNLFVQNLRKSVIYTVHRKECEYTQNLNEFCLWKTVTTVCLFDHLE